MSTRIPDRTTVAPAASSPARAEQRRLGAAIRTSSLKPAERLALWTAADLAATAAEDGRPFAISIEELSEQTGMAVGAVAKVVSGLAASGWIARTEAGQWLPTVPAPRSAE